MPTDTLAPAHISADVAALPDDWEALTDAARDCREGETVQRWRMGEIALKVERKYGHEAVGKFAESIGVGRSTVYERAQMAAFYPISTRADFPILSWSHFRQALRLKERGLDCALDMLAEVENENLSIITMKARVDGKLGKPPIALKKVVDAPLCVVKDDREYVVNGDGLVYVAIALPAKDAAAVRGISGGTIRVYQVVTGEAA